MLAGWQVSANGRLVLHDIRDGFAFVESIVARTSPALGRDDREDLCAYLVGELWIVSCDYDPSRGLFSTFAGCVLRRRCADFARQRYGRTVWRFKNGRVHTRPRVELVSLDADEGARARLESALATQRGDPSPSGGSACAGLLAERDRLRARDYQELGLEPPPRASG
jgi:hypothetical protein